jgi:hypothetical protein
MDGRPGDGGMDRFTEETVEITVTDATVIQSSMFGEEDVVLTDIGIADLKRKATC